MAKLLCLLLLLVGASVHASTLLYNINGYTLENGELIRFAALEYDESDVVAIYSASDALPQRDGQQRIDGLGRTVLPGLIDAHGHVASLGRALASIDLRAASSEAEAAAMVANAQAGSGWLVGSGWNQTHWKDGAFPTRHSLDSHAISQPVLLSRVDGHAVWVNSIALEKAGIDASTKDPSGGQIVRDDQGEPTGVLIDNAIRMVWAVMPEPSVDDIRGDLRRAMSHLVSLGVTGTHDAGVSIQHIESYKRLLKDGELPIRIYAMAGLSYPSIPEMLEDGPFGDPAGKFSVRSVKILSDGALGSRGAALIDDYSDEPGNRGLFLRTLEQLGEDIRLSAGYGFQVNVHAIGDDANKRVLDEFAKLNKLEDQASRRHRIEHAQILRLQDFARYRELGVLASIQPTHATSDKNMAGARLGEERLEGAYAWQTFIDNDVMLVGGSDYPVEPANPFFGLHAAVTRQDRQGQPDGGWRKQDALSREQALALFTENAAYAGHSESRLGRLLPGYAADFILVEDDYFAVNEADIWRNQVLTTVVAGEVVYSSTDSPLK